MKDMKQHQVLYNCMQYTENIRDLLMQEVKSNKNGNQQQIIIVQKLQISDLSRVGWRLTC